MRFVSLWYVKRFCTAFIKTSAQCGFAKNCLKRYLQFLRGCKAAFYRWLSDGELVGSVTAFAGNTLPEGWLLCNGSAVSRETYAALYSVIGDTYGRGDGTNTFNLPNLVDKFVEGSATAGTVKSAGLPNITGYFDIRKWNSVGAGIMTMTGAFNGGADGVSGNGIAGNSTLANAQGVTFNASRSSSIYGNANTVQPPAVTMKYAIYSGVVSKKLWRRTI